MSVEMKGRETSGVLLKIKSAPSNKWKDEKAHRFGWAFEKRVGVPVRLRF
jgi:hypothetical protein